MPIAVAINKSEISLPIGTEGGFFPAAFTSAPETNEPHEQRGDGPERRADGELKRQNVDKISAREKDPRTEGDENAEHHAKEPRRKKGAEHIEGGCTRLRATA